jgi:SnoaL-like protein
VYLDPVSQDPTVSEAEAAVLFANASFYRAFADGDFAAMSQLWAERAPTSCLHPGASALVGRSLVLDSWRQILRGSPLAMRCDRPVARVVGSAAIVMCYEGNGDTPAHLAATNVFVLEDATWRMVHHHAGPLASPLPRPRPASSMN